jgi:hypothetical protein
VFVADTDVIKGLYEGVAAPAIPNSAALAVAASATVQRRVRDV